MWIRLILCTKDMVYAERLSAFFEREYGDKIELSLFSGVEYLLENLESHSADFILFGEELEQEAELHAGELPCMYAVLMKQMYETETDSVIRLAKYQRGDRLYKEILDAYSRGNKVKQIKTSEGKKEKAKVYVFLSANGGVGTTTIARAYARKCAMYEKVLYLDLGVLGLPWKQQEQAEGTAHGMDEILMALKSRRDILPIKLVSAVTDTTDKVYTYQPGSNPLNLLELTEDNISRLLEGIKTLSEYRKIIIDTGTALTDKEVALYKQCDYMICVVDGNGDETGKAKYNRLCEVLRILEQRDGIKLLRKMRIFKNKAVKNVETGWQSMEVREAGWAPRIDLDSYEAIEDRIMKSDAFDNMEIDDAG